MSDTTTRGIRIQIEPEYLPDASEPSSGSWVYAYHVTITNTGAETVQLVTRHWIITDASGRVEEVRGPGVVGETPILAPGQTFRYSSGCPLPTAMGTMHGSFQMVSSRGDRFDARIDPFTLVEPYTLN